jgi:hypothetical protein
LVRPAFLLLGIFVRGTRKMTAYLRRYLMFFAFIIALLMLIPSSVNAQYAGDINEDGVVDISDVILVLRMALDLDADIPCADIDGNGDVDISDVILTLRMALELDPLQDCDVCPDEDGDGYGNPASPSCEHPEFDCDDTDPNIYGEVCELVKKFAPVLRFSEDYEDHCLPMSAEEYFQKMLYPVTNDEADTITWNSPYDWNATLYPNGYPECDEDNDIVEVCSRPEYPVNYCMCGMCADDILKLKNGKTPTYYRVFRDDGFHQNRLRIAYYWFYGFQTHCNPDQLGPDGSHHGDWESIMVTTTPDQSAIDAVTYWFHGKYYTRLAGHFETDDGEERPVVYVGKLAHGSYHSKDHSGFEEGGKFHCCSYADWRNPILPDTEWSNTFDYLVNMDGNLETWMAAERAAAEKGLYNYEGKDYVVQGGPVVEGTDEKGPGDRWVWGPNRIKYYCEWNGEQSNWTVDGPISAYGYQKDWRIPSCTWQGCYEATCQLPYVVDKDYDYPADFNQGWPWGNQDVTATVYEAENFMGKKMILTTGQDKMPDLSGVISYLSDQISSVRVADGYILNLYRHVNYQDQAWQYVGENANIGYFNDYANSLKVIEGNSEKSACIYEAANYNEGPYTEEKCYYDVIEDGFLGLIHDEVSSVRVGEGYKVTLYKAIYFGGETCELTTDTANITEGCGNGWNDVASSLKIEKIN